MRCLGCVTSFKEGERLTMEDLKIQYKNYNIPLEDTGEKKLLKTIVSFLNSKGGTIFVGVEDTKGEVRGVQLSQQGQKDFRECIEGIVRHIRPAIDMKSKDSLIKVQFIPVVGRRGSQNKFVIKIIVNQGDPSRLYYFVRQLKLQSENQIEKHQLYYSFFRHNMGGIQQIKGLNLLQMIRTRAIHPIDVAPATHPNCNPQPEKIPQNIQKSQSPAIEKPSPKIKTPQPQVVQDGPCMVAINGVSQNELKDIQSVFKDNLAEFDVTLTTVYRSQQEALILKLQNKAQFEKTKNILKESLDFFSSLTRKFKFTIQAEDKRTLTIIKSDKDKVNASKTAAQTPKREEKKEEKPVSSTKKQVLPEEKPSKAKQEKKTNQVEKSKPTKPVQKVVKEEKQSRPQLRRQKQQPKKVPTPKKITDTFRLTFTHLDLGRVPQLIDYLRTVAPILKIEFIKYKNSLQAYLFTEDDKDLLYSNLAIKHRELQRFGFKQNNIIWGDNDGVILIKNYDRNKKNQFKTYIDSQLKVDLIKSEFIKVHKTTYVFALYLKSPEISCEWLDALLSNNQIKQYFGIPGSKDGNSAKMKILLALRNENSQSFANRDDYYYHQTN